MSVELEGLCVCVCFIVENTKIVFLFMLYCHSKVSKYF